MQGFLLDFPPNLVKKWRFGGKMSDVLRQISI